MKRTDPRNKFLTTEGLSWLQWWFRSWQPRMSRGLSVIRILRHSRPRLQPPPPSGPRWPGCPPRGRPRSWPGAPCWSPHSSRPRGMSVSRVATFPRSLAAACLYAWKNHVDKNQIKFKSLMLDHENEVFRILFHLWSPISQLGAEAVTIHVLSRSIFYSYSVSIQMNILYSEEYKLWNSHTSPHDLRQPWRHQWCQDNLIHTFTTYENLGEKELHTQRRAGQ